jgi:hypothetical protein
VRVDDAAGAHAKEVAYRRADAEMVKAWRNLPSDAANSRVCPACDGSGLDENCEDDCPAGGGTGALDADSESKAAWLTEHDVIKPERDALAEELREVYRDAARKIVDLFGRIAINDEARAELHRARPAGLEQHLLSAELHARGLDSFSYNTPSLLTSVHLFDWDSGRQIWPPHRPSMAAAFAATLMPADRRFSADRWKDNERRAAAQRAEQQHIADFYARQTQQQEEREMQRRGSVSLRPSARYRRATNNRRLG